MLRHARAHAQAAPSLVQMVNTLTSEGVYRFDALELAAAQANDTTWANLKSLCPNARMQQLYTQ